jgi:hypothetical protein
VHDFGGGGGGFGAEDPGDPDEGLWHHRLTVTCDDRAGLLADLSEHLRAHEVDIVSAAVATDTDSGHIVDSFAVRAAPRRELRRDAAPPMCSPRRKGQPGAQRHHRGAAAAALPCAACAHNLLRPAARAARA